MASKRLVDIEKFVSCKPQSTFAQVGLLALGRNSGVLMFGAQGVKLQLEFQEEYMDFRALDIATGAVISTMRIPLD